MVKALDAAWTEGVMTTTEEIRLRDVDGLGEIRVTAWTTDGRRTFRFAIHGDGEEEPNEVFDVSAEDAAQLAMGIAGTLK